jgi:D-methionine transport system ATP-binding protein
MKDITIKVENASKVYEGARSHCALKEVTLDICQGDIYGIVGMSGAGKSTLMRCLTGLERPSQGIIQVLGKDIAKLNTQELIDLRRQIGMIFQHFHLFSSRTVAENIAYAMEIHGVSKADQQTRIAELLKLVGLESKADAYPTQLSGGEKQRVGIARALANNPKILLCDEATSALDPKTTRSVLKLLQQLNRTLNLTIVVITHQIEVVKEICTHVAVLSKGELIEEGEVIKIFTKPEHTVTKHLLQQSSEHLPELLKDGRDSSSKLIRLFFDGERAKEPVISRMIKRFEIEANILFGSLDCIQNKMIGNLVIELTGNQTEMEKALAFLNEKQVRCEELE